MRVLELFAGKRCIGRAFERKGHDVFSVDWDESLDNIDLNCDIKELTAKKVIEKIGVPDVIWASPDCTTYSVSAIGRHRRKNHDTGELEAVSEYASVCDDVNRHLVNLIMELKPRYFFIENPRGGLRKMGFMSGLPRYTVTYCQYGDNRMKPTDIWTNHPDPCFKPMCRNGDKCHTPAPRGSHSGTEGLKNRLDKAAIPEQLCDHIVEICEGTLKPRSST